MARLQKGRWVRSCCPHISQPWRRNMAVCNFTLDRGEHARDDPNSLLHTQFRVDKALVKAAAKPSNSKLK